MVTKTPETSKLIEKDDRLRGRRAGGGEKTCRQRRTGRRWKNGRLQGKPDQRRPPEGEHPSSARARSRRTRIPPRPRRDVANEDVYLYTISTYTYLHPFYFRYVWEPEKSIFASQEGTWRREKGHPVMKSTPPVYA
ncbi:hypothetical protein NDU88_000783 [Pleurodeles waltl]|uniref:Uncharacterized protein n=1 Tax=Pleurodeles waltl TaxID=8319 RepID=A0AAV7TFS7_PLEWA|nr:hypothetical protein NDU88_000783 [Pleurodeles waltl]